MIWKYSVNNMQRKRLTAVVDGAVWKKGTEGQAGTMWGRKVEKAREEIRGVQGEILLWARLAPQNGPQKCHRPKTQTDTNRPTFAAYSG